MLTQIGLGYVVPVPARLDAAADAVACGGAILGGLLAGVFALYPLPPAGFDTTAVGVPDDWPHQLDRLRRSTGTRTRTRRIAFDQWFLNLFPRQRPFVYNGGGYLTLNFVPSLATMIFGLLAGGCSAAVDRRRRKYGSSRAGESPA